MRFGKKLKDSISKKSRGVTEKLSQQYRDHLGEALVQKETKLNALEDALRQRDKELSEREMNLKKYYLLPRIYIQFPLFVAICIGVFLAYKVMQPVSGEIEVTGAPSVNQSPSNNTSTYLADPSAMNAEFYTISECLEGIKKSSGSKTLKMITDKPNNVSGFLENGDGFGCKLTSSGTKGTYVKGWYMVRE